MTHPMHEIDARPVGSMSDEELRHAERDLVLVSNHLTALAGLCRQRVNAIRSMLDRRDARRAKGEEVHPSRNGGESKGGLQLRRPPQERPTFSDHAVVRYLERARGIDLEEVRCAMTKAYDAGAVMAGGGIVLAEGLCHVRDARGFVKTIIPLEWLSEDDVEMAEATYRR